MVFVTSETFRLENDVHFLLISILHLTFSKFFNFLCSKHILKNASIISVKSVIPILKIYPENSLEIVAFYFIFLIFYFSLRLNCLTIRTLNIGEFHLNDAVLVISQCYFYNETCTLIILVVLVIYIIQ